MVVSESPSITDGQSSRAGGFSNRKAINMIGRGSDITFIVDENAPMEEVVRELAQQLSGRQGALFSEGGVSINTGRRSLTTEEKYLIRRVFEENSGLKVFRFVSTIGDYVIESDEYLDDLPRHYPWKFPQRRGTSRTLALDRNLSDLIGGNRRNRTQAMLIRSTFRSGESLHHHGDVVVLGDVNPGSEIKADGDIVVMGKLKGLPHAGASGDNEAAIIALEIASPRIRIGNCEGAIQAAGKTQKRRKRGRGAETGQPSIAYTRKGAVYVSPFAGRFARYTKGVLYDG